MSGLYGKYRAIVLDISDPEKRGRILVKCPKVLNNHELGWAESCFMPGHFFLPRKGDFVWIEFEEGDVHKPVWTGIMPTREYVKDYLMGSSSYYTTLATIKHPEGNIDTQSTRVNMKTSIDINLESAKDTNITTAGKTTINASGSVNVSGSSLNNNNYWSKDKTV